MDENYMKKALELAEKGKGFVDPNPLVGALIVKEGNIIGQGYHEYFGGPHAEINAFKNAVGDVTGATMYVTLEPCAHYGKTPPCVDAIIKHNIKRVVIGSIDPNPLVSKKGITRLKEHGIDVVYGVLDEEQKKLNKVFFKYIQTKMPYVVLKTAMTLDGKIATKTRESKWISNSLSRIRVHQLRHQLQAILVGVNTVNIDNPMLTVRLENQEVRQPHRVIVDTKLEIDEKSAIVKTAHDFPTTIMTSKEENIKAKRLKELGLNMVYIPLKDDNVDLVKAMAYLGEKGISSVLVEGGSAVNYSALMSNIVDEVHSIIAPKIVGGIKSPTPVGGIGIDQLSEAFSFKLESSEVLEDDVYLIYRRKL